MSQQVQGVIARSKDAPVELVTVNVPDPGPGEAVVTILACGVCHTDLHYRQGGIGDDYPYLLGHEAAGTVESVGAGVNDLAPGDYVILNWRACCGACRACKRGRPWYCFATYNATQKMALEDGTELSPALGIGAFIDKTLVAAGQCTKVDPAARPAVAGLLGCGVMAGLGAAIHTGNVGRGDSVAVIGCGGVGAAAVAGARLAGAAKIIAIDIDDRKLATARELGATDVINSRSTDPLPAVQELTGGFGGCGDRRRRPSRDVSAGVLRPGPGRHGGTGRRTHAGDEARVALAGRLRPVAPPKSKLGTATACPTGPVPDADRPVPAGPIATRRLRHRGDRDPRRRGRLRPDAHGRRAAVGRDHAP